MKVCTKNRVNDVAQRKNGSYQVLKGGKIEFCMTFAYPGSKKVFSQKLQFELNEKKKMDIFDKFDLKLRTLEEKL